jgi:hypothetical protein
MSDTFSQWKLRRRLKRLLNHATKIVYTEKLDFNETIRALTVNNTHASLVEMYVAIEAVLKIEEAFQELVYFEYDISDKEIIGKAMNEALAVLDQVYQSEHDSELTKLHLELAEAKARHAFNLIRMSFMLSKTQPEETFAGAVYRGCRLKQGPLSIKQRRTFKHLTDQLTNASDRLKQIDAKLKENGYETE